MGMRRIESVAVVAFGILAVMPEPAAAAELLVLSQPGCVWCARFEAEIAPGYPHTDEGRRAPLRRIDITGPWPADLAGVVPDRLTPTFVLLADDGAEVARLRGYPGDHFFWPMLGEMMRKLGPAPTM